MKKSKLASEVEKLAKRAAAMDSLIYMSVCRGEIGNSNVEITTIGIRIIKMLYAAGFQTKQIQQILRSLPRTDASVKEIRKATRKSLIERCIGV